MMWFNLNKVRQGAGAGRPHVGATKYAWFNEVNFRRAVSMAVDREAMIRSIYFGDAVRNWATTTKLLAMLEEAEAELPRELAPALEPYMRRVEAARPAARSAARRA